MGLARVGQKGYGYGGVVRQWATKAQLEIKKNQPGHYVQEELNAMRQTRNLLQLSSGKMAPE